MKKKLICMLMCVALLFSMTSLVYAEEIEDNDEYMEEEYNMEGTPSLSRWTNVSSASCDLYVSGGTATTSIITRGKTNVDTMVVYTYLQKKINGTWTNVYSAINKVSGSYISVSKTTSSGVTSGYTYRVRARIYAYVGATYELVTIYSYEKSY
jgi:hypothetical protein